MQARNVAFDLELRSSFRLPGMSPFRDTDAGSIRLQMVACQRLRMKRKTNDLGTRHGC
jgi:hypothetical protein